MTSLRRLTLLLLTLSAANAVAQGVDVSPVQVYLSPGTTSALVTLRNGASEARRYQIKVLAWQQDTAGEMKLEPTKDIAFYPAMLSLPAGEARNVRLGALTGFAAREKTYRLFIEELPPPPAPGVQQIRVLTRVGIPIFLQPTKPEQRAVLEEVSLHKGKLRVVLSNTGTQHVRPTEVRAEGKGAGGGLLFEKEWQGWYVLAGDKRIFEAEVPRAACAGLRQLTIQITTEPEPLGATLAPSRDACGS